MSIACTFDDARQCWEASEVYDLLTGLYSRAYLFGRLEKECALTRRHDDPLTLVLVDLDDFKVVNEALGRSQGDLVLAEVGRTLASLVRETDLVGRTGGDEFAILLPITDEGGARILIPRIASGLAAIRTSASPTGLSATMSHAGISRSAGLRNAEDLYRAARQALDGEKRHVRALEALAPLESLALSFASRVGSR